VSDPTYIIGYNVRFDQCLQGFESLYLYWYGGLFHVARAASPVCRWERSAPGFRQRAARAAWSRATSLAVASIRPTAWHHARPPPFPHTRRFLGPSPCAVKGGAAVAQRSSDPLRRVGGAHAGLRGSGGGVKQFFGRSAERGGPAHAARRRPLRRPDGRTQPEPDARARPDGAAFPRPGARSLLFWLAGPGAAPGRTAKRLVGCACLTHAQTHLG
jgi:hypothetical protein